MVNAAILVFSEIDVEHHAEGGDGAEQTEKHIGAASHLNGFVNTDAAGDEAAENGEADDGFGAGVAIGFDAGIFLGRHNK